MENIQYIGEHLVPGTIGRLIVWLGFATALLASVLYFMAWRRKDPGILRKAARWMYLGHSVSIVAVAGILFYLIFNHYFEYSYVWQYSSKELPVKYIISCFWAGQEGSFLVWAVWQALIGVSLLIFSRKWESPVMAVFALSQAFVTSMLLGVSFLGMKIGSSPFQLLRETVPTITDTIFMMPDYLKMIGDGNGLNPLLENIWMTIHPPILFLGYALALVPFCYAIASFMMRDPHTWISRALPWTLLALFMLGAGILLGGAWAYVSLTFGGFWAWDPVENSSLVPWMTLVAALHFMIVARKQNLALLASFVMVCLSYVLVLYASFLTRSGVLANTSAHSFGDNGMTAQLLVFLLTFFIMMIVLIGMHFRKLLLNREDILLSREFWMFIGSVIMVLAAFQVIFTTSIPVINTVLNLNLAPPVDPVAFYNRWQAPFAVLIAGFIGFSQILHYQANNPGQFIKRVGIPFTLSVLLTVPLVFAGVVHGLVFILLSILAVFVIVSALYALLVLGIRPRNTAAMITHLGFALFLLGAVITFSNSRVISTNTSQYDLGDSRSNAENLVLMRGDTLQMAGYHVTYSGNRKEGNTTHYRVDFLAGPEENYAYRFTLHPSVNVHPKMGAVYNPDTRRTLGSDIYTYIAHVNPEPDYIVLKAMRNPYINVLWAGSVIMIAGLLIAFIRRVRARMAGGR